MNELEAFIAAYPPERLALELESDPAFAMFNLCWTEPQEIAPACAALGLATKEDALRFVIGLQDAVGAAGPAFVNQVDPRIPVSYDSLAMVDWPVIHEAIAKQFKLHSSFRVDQSDRSYRLATHEQLMQIAALCPARRRRWAAERMDCEDFTRAFLGWLAGKGFGNLAIGFCGYLAFDWFGALVGGHAVALAMDTDHRLWLIEPQNGQLYPADYVKLGGFSAAARIELTRAIY